jgi:LemA protein
MISIAALIVVLAIVAVAMIYNRLVRDRNRVDAAWSDIDVQLQRRHDLVPQLVTAVDQYAGYEKATLEAVTALRAEAVQLTRTNKLDELGRTEQKLDDGIQRLIAVAEEYPDLKANENFLNLQDELAETENYLQFARRFYNGSVREFNTRVESVPSNIVAGLFGFGQRDFYQKESDDAGNVPLVDLGSVE